jgi:hypothetical protein
MTSSLPPVVVCTCYSKYSGNVNRRILIQAAPGINARSYSKDTLKKARVMAQVLKHLLNKCKSLRSNPSTTKNKFKFKKTTSAPFFTTSRKFTP